MRRLRLRSYFLFLGLDSLLVRRDLGLTIRNRRGRALILRDRRTARSAQGKYHCKKT
jgi:hypothetical protein